MRNGIDGDQGVVGFFSDPMEARAVASSAARVDQVDRLVLHVPCPGVAVASLVRAVGATEQLLDVLGSHADVGLASTASRYLRRHRRTWPLGEVTPGLGSVYWCRRRPDLTPAQYHEAWTNGHGPLALRHHMGMWDYDQVSVVEVHHGESIADVDGVAVVQWATEADLVDRFVDGPVGAAAIRADAGSFTDLARTDRFLMHEHVLVETSMSRGPRWLTDFRSEPFAPPVADVWSVVGDFGAICDWWPAGLVTCRSEGAGEGMRRTLERAGGGEVVEVLRHFRPDEAMLELEIVEGLPDGLLRYSCRYEVRADGDGCRLDWQPTGLVAAGADPVFAAMVDRGWEQVRQGLRSMFAPR